MAIAYAVVSLITGTLVALTGALKLGGHPSMAKNAAHLGYSEEAFRRIGMLEAAAVAGLIGGLWWAPIGVAAAIGVALLMSGAVVAHVRVHDPAPASAPAAVCGLLAVATAVLGVAR
jgi:hypothetical protein